MNLTPPGSVRAWEKDADAGLRSGSVLSTKHSCWIYWAVAVPASTQKSVVNWTPSIYWRSFPTSRHSNQKLSEQQGQDKHKTFGQLNRSARLRQGWAICNIDTDVPLVDQWTLQSSLSYNQAYVPGPRFGFKSTLAHQAHITLSGPMTNIVQQGSSLGSYLTFSSPQSPQ